MIAVILAGGKGTRMGYLSKNIPKPMIKFGNKPLLQHQIELLKSYNISKIYLITGYLSNIIKDYFQTGEKFGVNISYYEEKKPLGTTGGIKELESSLKSDFLAIYGDIAFDMDIGKLINFHKNKKSDCTLVVHPNDHPYDSDLLETDENDRIISFHPKPHKKKNYKNLVNAAIYLFSPKVLKYLEKGVKRDFGKDIFPNIFNKLNMFAYNTPEYIKDMGTVDRLKEVESDFKSGKIKKLNSINFQRAIFLDRDGVINDDINYLHKLSNFKLLSGTSKAIKKINKSNYLAIVVTNQSVIARNLCSIQELENIHKKMETQLGRAGAKLDYIYFCPHHPDSGYPEENQKFKIKCECRKPNIGMIKKASKRFNIALSHSFIIGDSVRDIQCGKNAGLTTIGVRTGKGCKDGNVLPDFLVDDLMDAVNLIIDDPYKEKVGKVIELMSLVNEYPKIIAIGGNSRSGKTIFSKYLKKEYENLQKKVLIISLDSWILSKNKRKKSYNVYDRFQINKIEKDIRDILNGKIISLNHYDTLSQQILNKKVLYNINQYDLIIIDGVVALSIKEILERAQLKIFLQINKSNYKKRFKNFYKWKMFDKKEINDLIESRFKDEYIKINKDRKKADLIFSF